MRTLSLIVSLLLLIAALVLSGLQFGCETRSMARHTSGDDLRDSSRSIAERERVLATTQPSSATAPEPNGGPVVGGQIQFRYDLRHREPADAASNLDLLTDATTGLQGRGAVARPPPPPSSAPIESVLEAQRRLDAQYNQRRVVAPPPLSCTLRPGEELWVIERRTALAAPERDELPGCGSLVARPVVADPLNTGRAYSAELLAGRAEFVPVPLAHTDVSARIDAYISTVRVTQQFENPFADKIEALYVFPLPEDAAVSDFVMTIGDRRIRGVVREREEARQVYEQARRQGHVATLLTQERPNIFTQHVANIEPGKRIDVDITYFNTLAYLDGYYEFVFPMVVGPRFNPAYTKDWKPFHDGVGAVGRGSTWASGQETEVQYLRPGERSGHDIGLRVAINAGVPIESIECRSHQVSVNAAADTPGRAEVVLSRLDSVPNKDFVLRYRVAGSDTKSAMLTQVDERGGFFSLMLVPPADLQYVDRGPVEMVFVVDCSGSMEGEPLAQARRAVEHALRGLEPGDTFQVINFAESASQLGSRPLAAEWENVRRGIDYVRSLAAGGGTHMLNGLRAALDFPHDDRRLRFVCFLTDGYIGNETEILDTLKDRLGESRVLSMGMGSSPNRYLLEEMARVGRGAAAHVGLGDDAAQVMGMFMDRVSHPALTRMEIDWGGLDVTDVHPSRLPDLFVGRPVLVTGRFRGAGATTVKVTGRVGRHGERVPILIPVTVGEDESARGSGSLAAVWARQRIAQLSRRTLGRYGDDEKTIASSITRTALDFGLMSAYTSFVAVDSLTRTHGPLGGGSTVEVAVPVPEGTNYHTTVQERRAPQARRPGDDRP